MQLATLNGYKELVQLLLDSGANPQAKNQVHTSSNLPILHLHLHCTTVQYGKSAKDFAQSFNHHVSYYKPMATTKS